MFRSAPFFLLRWERGRPKPQPVKPERKLDTAQVDWDARIREAIAHERQFQRDVMIGVIAALKASDDLERATRSLTAAPCASA